jgi:polygalacturonase
MNKLQIISLLVAGIPAWGAGGTYNVADYGAHNDGSALSTEAFRAAIHAAGAAGGGTVYVPAGHYVTGPIELVSNLVLRFDAGAVVRFPAMRLPFTAGRQQGVECLTPIPLIGGRNLENVTITGRGQLTTDQSEWLALMGRPQFRSETSAGAEFGPAWNRLLELLELKKPVAEAVYREVAPFLRPSFIRFMDSRNVLVDGLHISGSPMWAIHLLYADHAVVRNVIIETYPGAETDGIVVDSSRNVEIADSYFDTGDDAVVLKSGKDADGLRVNRPTENIAITNCTFHRAHGAVTLGSETSGWIRNVVASNITCNGTQMGIRIKSRRGRGGGVEHVRFNNWTMENVGQGINVTNYYVMAGEARTGSEPVTEKTPVFRDIAISHVTMARARVAIDVEGLPEMPISGLRISDVVASSKTGVKAYHTAGLELHDVAVEGDPKSGPAFLIRDSQELELDGVSSRRPAAGFPVVRLDGCPGARVRGSRAFPGTETFLSVAVGQLKTIVFDSSALAGARRPVEETAKEFPMVPESSTERNQ